MDAPDTPHCRPKSSFGAFRTVSLLHELRCKTGKTGVINAQNHATKSHQNFLQWTHPIHPIGPYIHVLWHFGPFCYCMKFGANRAELGWLTHKFAERCRFGIFRNERTTYSSLDPKLMFWDISDHSITARSSVPKRAELGLSMHKFVKGCSVRIFRNERTRYTPLDLNLMFWCISDHSVIGWTSLQNGPS
jgi:hypothetical protein